jgi:hypothetical protein
LELELSSQLSEHAKRRVRRSRDSIRSDVQWSLANVPLNEEISLTPKHLVRSDCDCITCFVGLQRCPQPRRPSKRGVHSQQCASRAGKPCCNRRRCGSFPRTGAHMSDLHHAGVVFTQRDADPFVVGRAI